MTILDQIKALYDKGVTRVAINPQDFDDLIADYIVNATDFIPPFAVELWSTVNCPVGKILPAPNLSELLQKRSYGMMQFPNNKTMICKDCKRLGHPSGFYGDGRCEYCHWHAMTSNPRTMAMLDDAQAEMMDIDYPDTDSD